LRAASVQETIAQNRTELSMPGPRRVWRWTGPAL